MNPAPIPAPEGAITRRSLHFFWLADYSGSMTGIKIAKLNQAIREALPEVRNAVADHPEVQILMRAIKFADTASWHVGPAPQTIEEFVWPELSTDGVTATAQAVRLLTSELALDKMPRRGYPPVCILVSDGCCTDPPNEYDAAIHALLKEPWGKKAVRLAIGINDWDGDRAEYDEAQLLKFISHPEIGVLKADSPERLVQQIRWASVAASVGASVGRSKMTDQDAHVVLSPPPPDITSSKDLF